MTDENDVARRASLPARVVRTVTKAYFDLIVDAENVDIEHSRRGLNLLGNVVPVAGGVTVEKTQVNGLRSEWHRPRTAAAGKVMLYLHGGAYVLGGCASHRHLVSYLAKEGQVDALLPEYRLAPEHPFPAAVEDAVEVFCWLLDNGYDAGDIIVAGDSAGGGLSVSMMLALRDRELPLPAAAFLLSPWLDLSASGESMQTREDHDPWFSPTDIPIVARYYCREDQIRDPLVSPVYADMRGIPPTHIQVGDDEILLSDATRLASAMAPGMSFIGTTAETTKRSG